MANAKIDVVGHDEIPLVVDLYGQVFRPAKGAEFFRRRFQGRYNSLILIASIDERPIGFFTGFELKPNVYFAWLFGVLAECRRMGIASQLMDAMHAWVREQDYHAIRFECQNLHRAMLHMAIANGYDVVGIRWDPDRNANLVIFEKYLTESDP